MEKLTQMSCADFIKALSAKVSVPGGGGAAALAGALSAALCSMVGNFTIGKRKYASVEPAIKILLERGEVLQVQLLELVDADANAFAPLAKAYGISQDDPERPIVLEQATLNACKAPLEMVECCAEVTDLLEEVLENGNKMLISDVGCGALLCRAAMECAAMNVYINTRSLKDRKIAAQLERHVDAMLTCCLPKTETIARSVAEQIRPGGSNYG